MKSRFEDAPRERDRDSRDAPRDSSPKRRKTRGTRWGSESQKVNYPGLPTALPPNLTAAQQDSYVIHLRVEELGRTFRLGTYIPREKRSVSPEPTYDSSGQRNNTRAARYASKVDEQKMALVELGLRTIPGFRPPIDYKRAVKLQEKVYLPVRDFPEINFIGLLIGPRGHTLKKMENDTGVKISIRGKGSIKEGKSRADGSTQPGEDEDLHCLVMAENELNLKAGMKMIDQIIETATSIPEGQNELKRNQLRELAALNGTLREDEAQICTNCGSIGHRRWECPEASNFTASIMCRICNGIGHLARDCIQKNNPELVLAANANEENMDMEYANLMAELGNKNAGSLRVGGAAAPWASAISATPWASNSSGAEVVNSTPWVQPVEKSAGQHVHEHDQNQGQAPPPPPQ